MIGRFVFSPFSSVKNKKECLNSEKETYLLIKESLSNIKNPRNTQEYSNINKFISDYNKTIDTINQELKQIEQCETQLIKRYRCAYLLLIVLSIVSIVVSILHTAVNMNVTLVLPIFLFIQYLVLILIITNTNKVWLFTISIVILLIPVLLFVLESLAPEVITIRGLIDRFIPYISIVLSVIGVFGAVTIKKNDF